MSRYNREYDILFIHNPKTAGTSMERREFIGGGGHYPIWGWEKFINGLDRIYKFGFVRNPLDRTVSAFFHKPNVTDYNQNKPGFKEFVRELGEKWEEPPYNYPEVTNLFYHHHFLPQWYFLCDKNKQIAVDFVGRFEHLKRDWKKVCEKLKVSDELGHYRETKHKPYQDYYDKTTEETVRDIYKKDFKIFKYE